MDEERCFAGFGGPVPVVRGLENCRSGPKPKGKRPCCLPQAWRPRSRPRPRPPPTAPQTPKGWRNWPISFPMTGWFPLGPGAGGRGGCHPGPQPELGPGGGNPDFRGHPGGQLFCQGHHRLRDGLKRRLAGRALGALETGWQRGGAHLPHPHQRGLFPELHRLLLHRYGHPYQ